MDSGTIRIFNQNTCQEVKTLPKKPKAPVRLLRFGVREGILVSADSKAVRVWDTATWAQLREFKIPALPMSLSLAEEDQFLLVSLKNNHFSTWDLTTGELKYSDDWTQNLEGQRALSFRRPIAAACNVEERLLAVVYRGQDILIWDFEGDNLLETYTKEEGASSSTRRTANSGVISVVFGAGPNVTLLAAAYLDGESATWSFSTPTKELSKMPHSQMHRYLHPRQMDERSRPGIPGG
jgi:WD40 repeat protein